MEKTKQVTDCILIKASDTSEWDYCNFALISCPAEWKILLKRRLEQIKPFESDSSFRALVFWDFNVDFLQNRTRASDDEIVDEETFFEEKNWQYVVLNNNEFDEIARPENKIRAHQLVLYSRGTAKFQAWGEHTNEEFTTEEFSIDDLLA
ncbi:MAG: hypothetical protein P4L51_23700 [Puia sp.]|nr:hypothetical protein [Puia sp.]